MDNTTRFLKANRKMPVLSFRANPELKEIIIKYAKIQGFVDKESGKVNMNKTLLEIVVDYFKIQGILEMDYRSTI